MRFEQGQEYDFDDLPESDMTTSGTWELVGDKTLGGIVDGHYVTLEFSKVECVDVRPTDSTEESDTA